MLEYLDRESLQRRQEKVLAYLPCSPEISRPAFLKSKGKPRKPLRTSLPLPTTIWQLFVPRPRTFLPCRWVAACDRDLQIRDGRLFCYLGVNSGRNLPSHSPPVGLKATAQTTTALLLCADLRQYLVVLDRYGAPVTYLLAEALPSLASAYATYPPVPLDRGYASYRLYST
jgi:hypothetical protein